MDNLSTILVIDDEPDNFDVVEALLDGEPYQLNYVSNGEQAFELLKSFRPDVILLDVMMPVMNGIEFCERFKSTPQWQHIPVIMITALTATEDLARCFKAGADDFISKPVKGLELRARLSSMLRIKHQYDSLQNLLQLREDMTHMVIHDLRNPLATIALAADMLQRPNYPPERQETKLKQIAIATKELQSLIDTLLLMAKLEAGKLTLEWMPADLTALCMSALSGFEAIAEQKKLTLEAHLPEPGGCVMVDMLLFRRIIDNLLSNAIKFSPSHSTIRLAAGYGNPGGGWIEVADHGAGVTEEMRHSIFERYEIGTLMKEVNQTGLGLAFCKIAIEAHHGRISVCDNQPMGAIFTIELPAAPATTTPQAFLKN